MVEQEGHWPLHVRRRWITRRRILAAALLALIGIGTLRSRNREQEARIDRLARSASSGRVYVRTVRPEWLKRFDVLIGDLDIGTNHVTELNLAHLCDDVFLDLQSLPHLKELHLTDAQPPMRDADLRHLSGLQQLEYLSLQRAHVDGTGLKHLRGLSNLRELYLDQTPLREGLEHVGRLRKLERLTLSDTTVTDADVQHLAGLSSLQSLGLSDTPITDAGLVQLGGLRGLRGLYLNNTRITNAGLGHLSGLANLVDLQLRGTRVTDEGLKPLSGLLRLQSVDVRYTQVGEEGARALQQSLPNCQVGFGE